jgi:hypothetical protein
VFTFAEPIVADAGHGIKQLHLHRLERLLRLLQKERASELYKRVHNSWLSSNGRKREEWRALFKGFLNDLQTISVLLRDVVAHFEFRVKAESGITAAGKIYV